MTLDQLAAIADEQTVMNDHVKCESHAPHICSEEVTHRAFGCLGPRNICLSAYTVNKYRMYHGLYCIGCDRPAADCWRFIPI